MIALKTISWLPRGGKAEHSHPEDKISVAKGEEVVKIWKIRPVPSCWSCRQNYDWNIFSFDGQITSTPPIALCLSWQQESWLSKALSETKQIGLFCCPKKLLMSIILAYGSGRTSISTKQDTKIINIHVGAADLFETISCKWLTCIAGL